MKNKKRKLILLVLLLIVITAFSSTFVSATVNKKNKIPIPVVQKDVYVYDEDNIIDDDIEKQVNTLLVQLEEKTGAEVVVVTVNSLMGEQIEDYSIYLANTLKIGKKNKDNGVLLLISKADKKVRLEIGKGLEGCLNDSKCGRILDEYFVPYREKNEYSEGTKQTIQAVVAVIAKEYNTSIEGIDETLVQQIEEHNEIEGCTIIIVLMIIIFIILISAMIFPTMFGGSYNSGSESGYIGGGFGSSGGSSFGGGSFGGGGASR